MQVEAPTVAQRWPSFRLAAVLLALGLLLPGFLSIWWLPEFRLPNLGWRIVGSTGYPWDYPAWSFSITVLKMAALVAWLAPRGRWRSRRPWLVGAMSGVFFVGGMHALACAVANIEGLTGGFWFALNVQSACLSAFVYLASFVLAVLWVIRQKAKPFPGFALGLFIAIALPAFLEWCLYNVPAEPRFFFHS